MNKWERENKYNEDRNRLQERKKWDEGCVLRK
jgi:hypothetical protein